MCILYWQPYLFVRTAATCLLASAGAVVWTTTDRDNYNCPVIISSRSLSAMAFLTFYDCIAKSCRHCDHTV